MPSPRPVPIRLRKAFESIQMINSECDLICSPRCPFYNNNSRVCIIPELKMAIKAEFNDAHYRFNRGIFDVIREIEP